MASLSAFIPASQNGVPNVGSNSKFAILYSSSGSFYELCPDASATGPGVVTTGPLPPADLTMSIGVCYLIPHGTPFSAGACAGTVQFQAITVTSSCSYGSPSVSHPPNVSSVGGPNVQYYGWSQQYGIVSGTQTAGYSYDFYLVSSSSAAWGVTGQYGPMVNINTGGTTYNGAPAFNVLMVQTR
jgi:hypothetical protein